MSQNPAAWGSNRPVRIAVLHLDSLVCLPALNDLFDELGNRIVVLGSSDRLDGFPSLLREMRRSIGRSGLALTLALGFDIVAQRIAAALAPAFAFLLRPLVRGIPGLRGPRALAARAGAAWRVVGNINSDKGREAIAAIRPDLVIALHFDQILQQSFLEAVGCPVLNVHPSLLPAHRGPCPSFWTLLHGDATVGATVHYIVDETIDSGPVLVRRSRNAPATRCMGELDEILLRDGVQALLALLRWTDAPDATPAKSASVSAYESFPDRAAVRRARRAGIRLWRLGQSARLIGGLVAGARE